MQLVLQICTAVVKWLHFFREEAADLDAALVCLYCVPQLLCFVASVRIVFTISLIRFAGRGLGVGVLGSTTVNY